MCCDNGMTTFIRSVTASVFLILFASVGSLTAAGARGSKTGSTEGTFVGIEHANETFFLIREKGSSYDHPFIILRPDESVKPYLDHPDKFKGHPVKVYWVRKFTGDGIMTFVEKVEEGGGESKK